MFESIIQWISDSASENLNALLDIIFSVIGFNTDLFNTAFPFAYMGYQLFRGVAVGLALLLGLAGAFSFIIGSERNQTSPIRIVVRVFIAVFCVYMGNYLLESVMDMSRYAYDAFLTEVAYGSVNPELGTAAGLGTVLLNGVQNAVSMGLPSILDLLLYILIAWNIIKLGFEILQRYVSCFVLMYLSPMAFSMLAHESTADFCKRYIIMYTGQCLLMVLDIWFLKMGVSLIVTLATGVFDQVSIILYMLMGLAMLKLGQKMDSIMSQFGLPTAAIGNNLTGELIGAGAMVLSTLNFGKGVFGGHSGGGNQVLGSNQPTGGAKIPPATDLRGVINAGMTTARQTDGNIFKKVSAGVGAAVRKVPAMFPGSAEAKAAWAADANAAWAKDAATTFSAGQSGSMNADQRVFASRNPRVAGDILNCFTGTQSNNEVRDAAAVVDGLGIDNMDRSAKEMVEVARGSSPANSVKSTMDASGMTFSYERNGKQITHQLSSQQQMDNHHATERDLYTAYTGNDGQHYYYRRSEAFAPSRSSMDIQRDNLISHLDSFAANPAATSLSDADVTNMRKNQDITASVFTRMGNAGTELRYKDGGSKAVTPEQQHNMTTISQTLDGMNISGMPAKTKNDLIGRLRAGEVDSAALNKNGLQVEYQNAAAQKQTFTMLSSEGAAAKGYTVKGKVDENALYSAGYTTTNIGGERFWWRSPTQTGKQHDATERAAKDDYI